MKMRRNVMLPLPAVLQAQFTFTANNGAITSTSPSCLGGAVTVPDKINGWPVTSIGDDAFDYCTSLTSVTIGTNVISVGGYAFSAAAA
jgi:hypothetical protein